MSPGDPDRPFGAANREALLSRYFEDAGPLTPADAWRHVYRLLLWADPTTGLAHCYESDKAQPGRPWYARTLAFHGWLAAAMETTPASLASEIDWLFRQATEQLAAGAARIQAQRAKQVDAQRAPIEGLGFPLPGEDRELQALITSELEPWLTEVPPAEVLRQLAQRVRLYLSQENKRRNLLGEGFEDTLAATIRRLPDGGSLTFAPARPFTSSPASGPRPEARSRVPSISLSSPAADASW